MINSNPVRQLVHLTEIGEYLHNEVDVHGEGLNSVEAGDERDGEEAQGVHLPPQEEVTLQIVEAEVVFTAAVDTKHKAKQDLMNIYFYSLWQHVCVIKHLHIPYSIYIYIYTHYIYTHYLMSLS